MILTYWVLKWFKIKHEYEAKYLFNDYKPFNYMTQHKSPDQIDFRTFGGKIPLKAHACES